MPIYELTQSQLVPVAETSFDVAGVRERDDLQRLLRTQVEIIAPDTLVIAEEFADWDDSRRRIDLLGIDKDANLVVIELKRTETGGHMELQAIRYAAMVSQMTFDQAVLAFSDYLERIGSEEDATEKLLSHLDWDEPNNDQFGQDVRIVLVSAEFSKELTSAVLFLNERMLDIRCVRLRPHELEGRTLLNVEQIVPVPEAADYQVRVRNKQQQEKRIKGVKWDESRLLQSITDKTSKAEADIARQLIEWIEPQVNWLFWGEGKRAGNCVPIIERDGVNYHLFYLNSRGHIGFRTARLRGKPVFESNDTIDRFIQTIAAIPGVDWDVANLSKRPKFPIGHLTKPDSLAQFKTAVTGLVEQIRAES